VAEAEAGDKANGDAPSDKDRVTNAADQMAAIRAEDNAPHRPSFLAV